MTNALNGDIKLSSIDEILMNLRKDKNYYNTPITEEEWMQEKQRDD